MRKKIKEREITKEMSTNLKEERREGEVPPQRCDRLITLQRKWLFKVIAAKGGGYPR